MTNSCNRPTGQPNRQNHLGESNASSKTGTQSKVTRSRERLAMAEPIPANGLNAGATKGVHDDAIGGEARTNAAVSTKIRPINLVLPFGSEFELKGYPK